MGAPRWVSILEFEPWTFLSPYTHPLTTCTKLI